MKNIKLGDESHSRNQKVYAHRDNAFPPGSPTDASKVWKKSKHITSMPWKSITIYQASAGWIKQKRQSNKTASKDGISTQNKYPNRFQHLRKTLLAESMDMQSKEWPAVI